MSTVSFILRTLSTCFLLMFFRALLLCASLPFFASKPLAPGSKVHLQLGIVRDIFYLRSKILLMTESLRALMGKRLSRERDGVRARRAAPAVAARRGWGGTGRLVLQRTEWSSATGDARPEVGPAALTSFFHIISYRMKCIR